MIPKYIQPKKSTLKHPKPYTSSPLKLNIEKLEKKFARVDLEFHGVIHYHLTPAFKRITVTDVINTLEKSEFTVTIVPILKATTDLCGTEDTIQCKKIKLVTYV